MQWHWASPARYCVPLGCPNDRGKRALLYFQHYEFDVIDDSCDAYGRHMIRVKADGVDEDRGAVFDSMTWPNMTSIASSAWPADLQVGPDGLTHPSTSPKSWLGWKR